MGLAVAAAAAGGAEVVLIHGAGHNETYALGGREYRDKLWDFVTNRTTGQDRGGPPPRSPPGPEP
jgi:hypothetical protein